MVTVLFICIIPLGGAAKFGIGGAIVSPNFGVAVVKTGSPVPTGGTAVGVAFPPIGGWAVGVCFETRSGATVVVAIGSEGLQPRISNTKDADVCHVFGYILTYLAIIFLLKSRVTSVVLSLFPLNVFGLVLLITSEYGVKLLPSLLVNTW